MLIAALTLIGPAGMAQTPAPIRHDVLSCQTDAALCDENQPTDANLVFAPVGPARGLVVLYPGSFASPAEYVLLLRTLGEFGSHVLGLRYTNDVPINGTCTWQVLEVDPDCFLKLRGETFYGEGAYDSSFLRTDAAHSVQNRMIKLLSYLSATWPSEGWDAFRDPDSLNATHGDLDPLWRRISVAGHSQGGGVALFAAREFRVARVVMLAAPNDFAANPGGTAIRIGSWIDPGTMATPVSDMYALVNARDPLYVCQVNVDDGGEVSSRQRVAVAVRVGRNAASPSTWLDYHNSPASIVFAAVWRQLFGASEP